MSRSTGLFAVCSFLVAACGSEGAVQEETGATAQEIIGVDPAEDPFAVPGVAALVGYAVAVDDDQFCTGFLIAPRWIVTAAHCFHPVAGAPEQFGVNCKRAADAGGVPDCEVDLGNVNWKDSWSGVEGRDFFTVKKIYPHASYVHGAANRAHDIALVEVSSDVPANTALPSPIYRKKWVDKLRVEDNVALTAAGWGAYRASGDVEALATTYDAQLRITGDFRYFGDITRCINDTAYDPGLSSSLLCAGHPTAGNVFGTQTLDGVALPEVAQGVCKGDSGGPLYYDVPRAGLAALGVTSASVGCSLQGYPGLFTRVGNYVDAFQRRSGNPFNLPQRIRGVITPAPWANGEFLQRGHGAGSWFHGTTQNHTPVAGDFNGDGYTDVAVYGKCSGDGHACWRVNHNLKNDTFDANDYGAGFTFQNTSFRSRPMAGDFNGDGLDDIAYAGTCGALNCWQVHRNRGNSTFAIDQYGWGNATFVSTNITSMPVSGDFNRDGYADIAYWGVCGNPRTNNWCVHLNNKAGGFVVDAYGGQGLFDGTEYRHTPMVGDFNGDGYDDIAYLGRCGASKCWLVQQNDQTGDFISVSYGGGTWFGGNELVATPVAADLNGDGYTDILAKQRCGDGGACLRTQLNNHNFGFDVVGGFDTPTFFSADARSTPFAADLNGDGAEGYAYLGKCGTEDCWQVRELR